MPAQLGSPTICQQFVEVILHTEMVLISNRQTSKRSHYLTKTSEVTSECGHMHYVLYFHHIQLSITSHKVAWYLFIYRLGSSAWSNVSWGKSLDLSLLGLFEFPISAAHTEKGWAKKGFRGGKNAVKPVKKRELDLKSFQSIRRNRKWTGQHANNPTSVSPRSIPKTPSSGDSIWFHGTVFRKKYLFQNFVFSSICSILQDSFTLKKKDLINLLHFFPPIKWPLFYEFLLVDRVKNDSNEPIPQVKSRRLSEKAGSYPFPEF